MRIALCDADTAAIKITKRILYEYANLRGIELLVEEYASGNELLINKIKYQLVILDYNTGDLNGLETARVLRSCNPDCTIIFLSSYKGFIIDSFEVSPFRFLLKPLDKSLLFSALDDFFKARSDNRPLLIKDGGDTFCLSANEIFYLEADNKNCFISLRNKKIRCRKTMARVYCELPKQHFGKINRAYVVNFNYISGYNRDAVTLRNGEQLHVGRCYFKSFREEFREFSDAMEL
ncbi:MAG: LytTR family DNA-binding domain-containing protein [Acutalibacteraceae bacterium]|nr:LytTR family DNA-binding domain-containing protein [Acutalibacteraceae bacterium]